jgi:plasmid stabilization system protein ParE
MSHATWSPQAEKDLEGVAFYIAVKDARPSVADRIVHEAYELGELIATQPGMGESRPEFGAGCRVFPFKRRWLLLYHPSQDGIEVLRFVDGTRDYGKLF